jgi:hypothetical protein
MRQRLPNYIESRTRGNIYLPHRSCYFGKQIPFGIIWSSTVEFDLMSPMFMKYVTSTAILRAWNNQKSLGARCVEYGVWLMTRMFLLQDCLCVLVVSVPGYRSRVPMFDSLTTRISGGHAVA